MTINDLVNNLNTDNQLFFKFLKSLSFQYKHDIRDSLSLFYQKQDSTFAANYTTWREIGYSVRRGEKGAKPKFNKDGEYLFDVSQTTAANKPELFPFYNVKQETIDDWLSTMDAENTTDKIIEYVKRWVGRTDYADTHSPENVNLLHLYGAYLIHLRLGIDEPTTLIQSIETARSDLSMTDLPISYHIGILHDTTFLMTHILNNFSLHLEQVEAFSKEADVLSDGDESVEERVSNPVIYETAVSKADKFDVKPEAYTEERQIDLPAEDKESNVKLPLPSDPVKTEMRLTMTADVILEALKAGSGIRNGKLRIFDMYQQGLSLAMLAEKFKGEYGVGGASPIGNYEGTDISASYSSKGFTIYQRSKPDNNIVLSWVEASQYAKVLVLENQYLTNAEYNQYLQEYGQPEIEELSLFSDLEEELDNTLETQSPSEDVSDDFDMTDPNFEYPSTSSLKIAANLHALELSKEIGDRPPTYDEQVSLAKYVGWGGLPDVFDERVSRYNDYRHSLRNVVSQTDYQSMMESVLTAYYTEPMVIDSMYRVLASAGLTGGRILDPAMGTGNFFTNMPHDIKKNATLVGVELDGVTGKLAKQLTPSADIHIKGFEETTLQPQSFDLVIGNVPFNNFNITDTHYSKPYAVHDYFFKKSLDVVKEGGIVAFITSTGTLDKKNSSFRKELAEVASLVGAVRLPANTFKRIAGTDVTTDILFFKKDTISLNKGEGWTQSVESERYPDVFYNEYFINHPDHILGEIVIKNYFRQTLSVKEDETRPLSDVLQPVLSSIFEDITLTNGVNPPVKLTDQPQEISRITDSSQLLIDDAPEFTFVNTGHEIAIKELENVTTYSLDTLVGKKLERMVSIRQTVRDLIVLQQQSSYSLEKFEELLLKANEYYDGFIQKYGYISDKKNSRLFKSDLHAPLLSSLELKQEDGSYIKADILKQATVRPIKEVLSVDSPIAALHVSLGKYNAVDLSYMTGLINLSEEELIQELKGHIYLDPETDSWVTKESYLSGDVKTKLLIARSENKRHDGKYQDNVMALEKSLPEDLEAKDIDLTIGTSWIPKEYYEEFLIELLELRHNTFSSFYSTIEYMPTESRWFIQCKMSGINNSYTTRKTFGTDRKNAWSLFEDSLNLKKTTVYDYIEEDGKRKAILNGKETTLARSKQQEIVNRFDSWVFSDKERADRLITIYNERFNRFVVREYDGSYLNFDGLNTEYTLRPHQANAVARGLSEGRALFAHVVGAGKTLTMIATGMLMKEQGIVNKPMYVVPNHLINEFSMDIMKFYPSKNILITTNDDFKKENRKKFIAKISSGNFDAVVIGHSQFEKIPLSKEFQLKHMKKEMDDIVIAIEEQKASDDESWSLKQMLLFKKKLEARMEKLLKDDKKDTHITFEETGIDCLFIDEAHVYKNLYTHTKLSNVAGVNTSNSLRASDMLLKCRYIQELNGDCKGVFFATGTPISNSMSELYTNMKYLQPDILETIGTEHFDSWASTFGEITSTLEINPEGSGYRMKDRFAKFHNIPELMSAFGQVADIQTNDMLDLPTPLIKTGKAQVIVTKPSDAQEMKMEEFSIRAELIRDGQVDPSDDNLLKLTHEAKLMAIDLRLLDENYSDDGSSKIAVCGDKVFSIWKETLTNKSTQLIFSDSGTPKPNKFNIYDEIKQQLIEKGIPANEIAFIHDANTEIRKKELFAKVRQGTVRILLGSTSKLGTGTNIQDKLIAAHHVDCPWRPSDIEQRNGRIVRQGNENKEVSIFQYVTEGTFDSFLWQTQENKLIYINQIMSGKSLSRSSADLDPTVLSAGEIKALATKNPLLLEKMTLDNKIRELRILQKQWQTDKHMLLKRMDDVPKEINISYKMIERMTLDLTEVKSEDEFSITLNGIEFDNRSEAGDHLINYVYNKKMLSSEKVVVGDYLGFKIEVAKTTLDGYVGILTKNRSYRFNLNLNSGLGSITRAINAISSIHEEIDNEVKNIAYNEAELAKMAQQADTPFTHEEELTELLENQLKIDAEIEYSTMMKEGKDVNLESEMDRETQSPIERDRPMPQQNHSQDTGLMR